MHAVCGRAHRPPPSQGVRFDLLHKYTHTIVCSELQVPILSIQSGAAWLGDDDDE